MTTEKTEAKSEAQAQKTAEANLAETRKAAAQQEAEGLRANSVLEPLSDSERKAAQQEGIKEAIKEGAKATYKMLTDGAIPGVANLKNQFIGSDEIMQFEHLLALSPEALKEAINDTKAGPGIPEEKIAGLLKLERNGQNRTDYVKVLLDALPVDHVRDVPGAGGPGYTNDTTPITEL